MVEPPWITVREPHTDRVVEGFITQEKYDLQGDRITLDAFIRRMPEIAQNAVIIYKHGHDVARGVVPLGLITKWRPVDDRIQIQACYNRGNEIIDAIWENEIKQYGNKAGFSIGGAIPREAKSCRYENGKKLCDAMDVIVCEISWTPHPANPGARVTYVNHTAKGLAKMPDKTDIEKEVAQKFLAAILPALASTAMNIGSSPSQAQPNKGPSGEVGDEEKEAQVEKYHGDIPPRASGRKSPCQDGFKPCPSPRCADCTASPADRERYNQFVGGKPEQKGGEKSAYGGKPDKDEVKCDCGGKGCEKCKCKKEGRSASGDVSGSEALSTGYGRTSTDELGPDDPAEQRRFSKNAVDEVEKSLIDRINALYAPVPDKIRAELAVMGCGTCDEYVQHRVKKGDNVALALLKLQKAIDEAQKRHSRDEQEQTDARLAQQDGKGVMESFGAKPGINGGVGQPHVEVPPERDKDPMNIAPDRSQEKPDGEEKMPENETEKERQDNVPASRLRDNPDGTVSDIYSPGKTGRRLPSSGYSWHDVEWDEPNEKALSALEKTLAELTEKAERIRVGTGWKPHSQVHENEPGPTFDERVRQRLADDQKKEKEARSASASVPAGQETYSPPPASEQHKVHTYTFAPEPGQSDPTNYRVGDVHERNREVSKEEKLDNPQCEHCNRTKREHEEAGPRHFAHEWSPRKEKSTMPDKTEPTQKSVEQRLLDIEKAVAELVKKFAEPTVLGGGSGPLAGVPTHSPEQMDMTRMATTKGQPEAFAMTKEDAIAKLLKEGVKIEGYQKAAPDITPQSQNTKPGPNIPMQKADESQPALGSHVMKRLEGWKNKGAK